LHTYSDDDDPHFLQNMISIDLSFVCFTSMHDVTLTSLHLPTQVSMGSLQDQVDNYLYLSPKKNY